MSNDDDFASLFEASLGGQANGARPRARIKVGQRVEGPVVAITDDTVFVDVGGRIEGQIARNELTNEKGELPFVVGDRIKATVADTGGRGAPILRTALGRGDVGIEELQAALEEGAPVEGEFTKAVKAGLEVAIAGRRGFCPASQADINYVADLETFVGQKCFFKILEIKDNGRSIVVSRKALLAEERAEQGKDLLARLEVGAELEGIIQSLTAYGAFVELGGLQGLIHISEISHSRIGAPADAVSVGESVRVKVLSIASNAEGKPPRVSLSMKALTQPAAGEAGPASEPAKIISVTVNRVEKHGVLVDSEDGSGIVPTAELDLPPGADPRRHLAPGSTMEVVVLRREHAGKFRFSAKAVSRVQEQQAYASFRGKGKGGRKDSLGSLGDLLAGIDLGGKIK